MANIFVSHSRQDTDLVDFFGRASDATGVQLIFEEFETDFNEDASSAIIIADIQSSNALFILLSQNVQNISHTRDWVLWETGIGVGRDIWVFEHHVQTGSISIVIPYLSHYVIIDTDELSFNYVLEIIKSYDDSHVLPLGLLGGLTGAAIGSVLDEEHRDRGGTIGGLVGLAGGIKFASSGQTKTRPMGIAVACNCCNSRYNIHFPIGIGAFKCPVCNTWWEFTTESL